MAKTSSIWTVSEMDAAKLEALVDVKKIPQRKFVKWFEAVVQHWPLGEISQHLVFQTYYECGLRLPSHPILTLVLEIRPAISFSLGTRNCYYICCQNWLYDLDRGLRIVTSSRAGCKSMRRKLVSQLQNIIPSRVVINNTNYDSLPGFFNRKAAEQSAAEVALMEIVKSIPTNASIPAVQETGLCKNLLQEYAQKMNYAIPSYICTKQASGVAPFICTVEIGGIQYIGAAARTKKEAEIKAARTALLAIQGQSEGCANGATKYIVVPGKRQGKETEKKPIETPKPLKVKKGGFKKKWNKRKFMKKNGQAVDVEKDEARVPGDVHDSDVPMQPTTITQEPSSDSIMLQPDEEARRLEQEPPRDTAMVQPNGEARSAKQEPPSGTAMLQPDKEASRVEPEPPRDTETMQPNEEARSVKQEPLSDTAMPQPNGEARRVEPEPRSKSVTVQPNGEATSMKEEPPNNSDIMQPKEEVRTVSQEPLNNASLLQPNKEPIVENSESVYEHKNQIPEL